MGLVARLAALAVAIAALAAQPLAAAPPSESAETHALPDPGWTELLKALGWSRLPEGGRAYSARWGNFGSGGWVQVIVEPGGKAHLLASWRSQPVVLQPNDLSAFEADLNRSGYWTRPVPLSASITCLDNCVMETLSAVAADGSNRSDEDSDATYELVQIAAARTAEPGAAPAPWWDPDSRHRLPILGVAHDGCGAGEPACAGVAAWAQLTERLAMPPLTAPGAERAYRLTLLPASGSPIVVTARLDRDRTLTSCTIWPWCGDDWSPNRVWVSSTLEPRRRIASFRRMADIEQGLAAADFATMPDRPTATPACASGRGDAWVFEAAIRGRWRYVAGGPCVASAIEPDLARFAALAGVHVKRLLAAQ